ncbi:MAG: hypothetical protein MZV70_56205 [Desulfobacterales bacterium]|nr:hypothetical protein [Desulfobacterales bacterium]
MRSFLEGAGREAIVALPERAGAAAAAAPLVPHLSGQARRVLPPGAGWKRTSAESLSAGCVNVAVSAAGRSLLPKEYAAAGKAEPGIPRVICCRRSTPPARWMPDTAGR